MLLNIFHMSEDVSALGTPPRNDDIASADNDQLDALFGLDLVGQQPTSLIK